MQPRQGMAERTTEEDHIKSMYHPHAVLLPESGQSLKKIFFSTKKKNEKLDKQMLWLTWNNTCSLVTSIILHLICKIQP